MKDLDSLLTQYKDVKESCKTNKFMKVVCLNYEFIFDRIISTKDDLLIQLAELKTNLIMQRKIINDKNHKEHLNKQIKDIAKIIDKENQLIASIKKILSKYNEKKSKTNKTSS